VRLRRTDKKLFKGSVFIEFSTEELQQKFVALDPKPTFEGKQLEWKTKKEYVTQKQEDIKAGRIKPSKSNNRPFNAFTHEKYAAKNGKPGKGGRGERNDNRGGRGGRRGSRGSGRDRGGKKDSRNGRDKHDKATSPPQKLAADSNGVPKLEDTLPESVPKRKAEEIGSETREAKKPKANQE
jgi:lupus La protein